MKNKLLVLLTVVVLLFGLTVPVFATEAPAITFSDDFQKLYCEGYTFSRINSSNKIMYIGSIYDEEFAEYEGYYDEYASVDGYYPDTYLAEYDNFQLTDAQKENILSIELVNEQNGILYDIAIHYKDGSILNVSFMRDDYIELYNSLVVGTDDTIMYVDLYYVGIEDLDESQKFTKKELELGEQVELDTTDIIDWFNIVSTTKDEKITILSGVLLISGDDDYYYVDLSDPEYMYEEYLEVYAYDYIKAYKINNEELCEDLSEGIVEYYNGDMNYIYNDELLDGLSKILLTIVLLIIPAALFVLFLILTIKAKEPKYRKLYIIITVITVVQIILFFVTRYFIFK